MKLQTWAEWVAKIAALTGGGVVEMRDGPGTDMTISVRWTQDGRSMSYDHALSMLEMKSMYGALQPCVLESITHAVRKMVPADAPDPVVRLRLAGQRVSELLASDARGVYASAELSAAIDGVSEILRKPDMALDPMALDQKVFAQMLTEHQDVIAKRIRVKLGGQDE